MKFPLNVVRLLGFLRLKCKLDPLLRCVAIEPTNDCNLKCKICEKSGRAVGYMDECLFRRVVDELSSLPYQVNLTLNHYGEPLLHPKFHDFACYALRQGLTVDFHTNGTLIDKSNLPFENCKIFLSDHNIDFNEKYLKYIDHVDVIEHDDTHPPKFWLEKGKDVWLYPYITSEARLTHHFNKQQSFCTSVFSSMTILWNGDVTLCCHDGSGKNVVGNITDKSILNFWVNKKYQQIRKTTLQHGKPHMPLCKTCEVWQLQTHVVEKISA